MQTYWCYEIEVDGRCVCSATGDALGLAISRAVTDCVYYQTVYPTSKITIGNIHESCARCNNTGYTNKYAAPGRAGKTVRCANCKGKKASGLCDHIAFSMPDAANRISLVQAS